MHQLVAIVKRTHAFSLKSVGFACAYAWIFTVFLCFSPPTTGESYSASFPLFYLISFASTVLILLLAAALTYLPSQLIARIPRHAWNWFGIVGAACAAGGTLWLAVAWFEGVLTPFEVIAIGISTGLGQAALFMQWGKVFASYPSEHFIEQVCAAFLIAALLVCAKSLLPPLADMLLIALMPLVSTSILIARFPLSSTPTTSQPTSRQKEPSRRDTSNLLARTCAGALGIGILMGVLRCLTNGEVSFNSLYAISKLLAASICCFVIYRQRTRHWIEFSMIYRYIMLLMAAGIALYPFVASSTLSVLVSRIGVSCLEAFMWIIVLGFVKCFNVVPLRAIGWCWASLTGGLCLGALVGYGLMGGGIVTSATTAGIALILLFGLLIVLLFVLTERDLIALEGWGVFSADHHADTAADSLPAMDTARQLIGSQAREISQRFCLSNREEEVLVLLAMGWSRSHIKSELYVSLGTVNTHISHIYAKLGIHSKEELLAFFT